MAAPTIMSLTRVRTGPQDIGDMLPCGVAFKNLASQLVEPDTVRFRWIEPGGEEVNEEYFGEGGNVVEDGSTGHYRFDLPLETSGVYKVRWECDGNYIGATEYTVTVRDSSFYS